MANEPTLVEQFTATHEGMRDFQRERVALEATELIWSLMKAEGLTRPQLASRLGMSMAELVPIMDGRTNLTLRGLSDVLHAFGRSLRLVDTPVSISTFPIKVEVVEGKVEEEKED